MTAKTVTSEELWNTHLFSGLNQAQLDLVIQSARVISLAEGEHLFEAQQHAQHFFLLRSGCIKLFLLSPDGNEKIIHIVSPKDTFGEAVMFMDGQNYPVNASALEASEVIAFQSSVFRKIMFAFAGGHECVAEKAAQRNRCPHPAKCNATIYQFSVTRNSTPGQWYSGN